MEKETLIDKLSEEAAEYFAQLIAECHIKDWHDDAYSMFFWRFCCLRILWLIELLLIIFSECFFLILIWKQQYSFEVRTIAKVFASAGIVAVFRCIYAAIKVKMLNDVVKMEVSLINNHKNLFRIEEDHSNGRGKDQ